MLILHRYITFQLHSNYVLICTSICAVIFLIFFFFFFSTLQYSLRTGGSTMQYSLAKYFLLGGNVSIKHNTSGDHVTNKSGQLIAKCQVLPRCSDTMMYIKSSTKTYTFCNVMLSWFVNATLL